MESEYKAWAMISFMLVPALMAALKRSHALTLQAEYDIYDEVLQQLERAQAIADDQEPVVQRARAIIETLFADLPQKPKGQI